MAKGKTDLAAALAANKAPDPAPAQPRAQEAPLTGQPVSRPNSRAGQVNISGWFDPTVKFALEELRLKRQRELGAKVTVRDLMAEAYNELFKKYGMPEFAPSKDRQG